MIKNTTKKTMVNTLTGVFWRNGAYFRAASDDNEDVRHCFWSWASLSLHVTLSPSVRHWRELVAESNPEIYK